MKYRKLSPYKLPERWFTHAEAVENILAEMLEQPHPPWVHMDAATVAQGLDNAARQGVSAPVVEAMWRYYELVNES
jgi:hypothetical protein